MKTQIQLRYLINLYFKEPIIYDLFGSWEIIFDENVYIDADYTPWQLMDDDNFLEDTIKVYY